MAEDSGQRKVPRLALAFARAALGMTGEGRGKRLARDDRVLPGHSR
jgi:hypothetical protein